MEALCLSPCIVYAVLGHLLFARPRRTLKTYRIEIWHKLAKVHGVNSTLLVQGQNSKRGQRSKVLIILIYKPRFIPRTAHTQGIQNDILFSVGPGHYRNMYCIRSGLSKDLYMRSRWIACLTQSRSSEEEDRPSCDDAMLRWRGDRLQVQLSKSEHRRIWLRSSSRVKVVARASIQGALLAKVALEKTHVPWTISRKGYMDYARTPIVFLMQRFVLTSWGTLVKSYDLRICYMIALIATKLPFAYFQALTSWYWSSQ